MSRLHELNPARALYQASMSEYFRAQDWWDEHTPDERMYYTGTDPYRTWQFLSGIERWMAVQDLLNAPNRDQGIADHVVGTAGALRRLPDARTCARACGRPKERTNGQ